MLMGTIACMLPALACLPAQLPGCLSGCLPVGSAPPHQPRTGAPFHAPRCQFFSFVTVQRSSLSGSSARTVVLAL